MGPLAGIRVLEIAGMGPTPFCGMLLGDMGADVLRLDRVSRAEAKVGPGDASDLRGRNKRSAQIDLKHPEGLKAALRLVGEADILLEGFRPGVAERMGIGPEACWQVNPRLVYARATGWGREGPLAMTAGHDINYLALTGALGAIGPKDGPPVPPLNLVGDYGGGALFMAFGAVCALNEAQRSGQGQVVDAAMIDGVASLLTVFHGMRQNGEWVSERGSNSIDGGSPDYGTYQAQDGLWLAVGAMEPRFYAALLEGLEISADGVPDRGDRANWPALRERFAARFAEKTRAEWIGIFEGTDACVAPVLTLDEAGAHPHNVARGMLRELDGRQHPAPAPRLSRTPGGLRLPPVMTGADTEAVLADWGFGADEIAAGLSAGYFARA